MNINEYSHLLTLSTCIYYYSIRKWFFLIGYFNRLVDFALEGMACVFYRWVCIFQLFKLSEIMGQDFSFFLVNLFLIMLIMLIILISQFYIIITIYKQMVDAANAQGLLDICLGYYMKGLASQSNRLIDSAKNIHARIGTGALFLEVPLKTLNSTFHYDRLIYLDTHCLRLLKCELVDEMLRAYDPLTQCIVLLRVNKPHFRTRPLEPESFFLKAQILDYLGPSDQSASRFQSSCHYENLAADDISDPIACSACGLIKSCATLKRCSRCQTVSYCSRECQSAEWPAHKQFCTALGSLKKDLV